MTIFGDLFITHSLSTPGLGAEPVAGTGGTDAPRPVLAPVLGLPPAHLSFDWWQRCDGVGGVVAPVHDVTAAPGQHRRGQQRD